MEEFEVKAKSAVVLEPSTLVDHLSYQASQRRSFDVRVGDAVTTFHGVRGGFDGDEDRHIVRLVQKHEAMASSADGLATGNGAGVYEVDLDDNFTLYADNAFVFDDEEEYVLNITVDDFIRDLALR